MTGTGAVNWEIIDKIYSVTGCIYKSLYSDVAMMLCFSTGGYCAVSMHG